MRDMDPDPIVQFGRWYLEAEAASEPLPMAMTLATVGPDGRPSGRVVLLKGCEGGGFVFYTNYDSRKGRDIAARSEVSLVFHWPLLERQVRVEGCAERVSSEESDRYFATRPYRSQLGAWASRQSEPLESREALEALVEEIRVRFPEGVPRPPHWGGYRVTPDVVEFWQAHEDRLNDRIVYERKAAVWTRYRLAP